MTDQTMNATVPTASAEATRRQAGALEESGWGERFVFVQPHNLCFWVYLWLTGVGVSQVWSYFDPQIGFYGEAFTIAAVLCGLCGLAWWLWFRHIDRWERQPVALAVAGLIWGAIPATFGFALTVNTAMLGIYPKLFGQDWTASWAAGFTAPFTEEAAKVCGFILIMGLAPRLVRTANDGLVIGAFIGLGFAAFEDFLYAANSTASAFGTDPVANAVQMSFTRIAFSFVSHPLFSALVCSGTIYLLGTAAQPRRVRTGIAFIGAGMFLHFTWDDAVGLGGGNGLATGAVMLASIILGFTVLSRAFRRAAPREHQFVRDILAVELEAGTLSTEELETVFSKKARRAYKRSAPNHHARRARKHLHRAILDLTHDVADAKGASTDAVRHGRAEVARMRAVAEPPAR